MPLPPVVADFKRHAERIYGERLHAVVLFGSNARAEATDDSDVDLLLVLRGTVDVFEEIDRLGEVIYELNVRHRTLLSLIPTSLDDFERRQSPLLINVRRDGVFA